MQCSNLQVEKIIAEVYAEFVKLHRMGHNVRIELQMRKEGERQAFDLRERISILEVELACQKQEHLQ